MSEQHVSSTILSLIFDAKIVLFVILTAILYHYYRIYSHLNEIPMPPCNLLLGHAPDFADITQLLDRISDYHIKYGRTLRILVGPVKPCLVTTDPKFCEFILTSNKVTKNKYAVKFLERWMGQGLVLSSGSLWKAHRKAMTPSFSQTSVLKKYIENFEHIGDKLVEVLENEVEKESTDVYVLSKRFALDVICESALKFSVNALEEKTNEFQEHIDFLNEILMRRVVSIPKRCPFLYTFTEDYKKEIAAVQVLEDFVGNIINKKIINRESLKEPEAFVDLLIQTKVDGEYMFDHEEIKMEVNTFIFAGHDTTSHGLAYTLLVLSKHPETQKKIIEEQIQIFGEQYKNHVVTYEDLGRMTYLEQVLKECLRLYPPVPTVGRRLTEDTKYGDMVLPKNLNVMINIYACHRDPQNFKNPEEFIPERFANTEKILPYTFMPFSGGGRVCIGQRFAMLELKSCVSKILRNFEVMPPNPQVEPKLYPSITMCSLNGVHVRFRRREIREF